MDLNIAYLGYRNGFPFPVNSNSKNEIWDGTSLDADSRPAHSDGVSSSSYLVGSGTEKPFGLTLEEMAELYWRARNFKKEFDISFSYSRQSTGNLYNGTLIADIDKYRDEELEIPEVDLIPGSVFALKTIAQSTRPLNSYQVDVTPTSGSPYSNTGRITSVLNIQFNSTVLLDELYYPRIRVEIYGLPLGGFFLQSYNNYNDGLESDVVMSFLDKEAMVWFFPQTDFENHIINGTIDLSITKWWPYGGNFDEDTGARM